MWDFVGACYEKRNRTYHINSVYRQQHTGICLSKPSVTFSQSLWRSKKIVDFALSSRWLPALCADSFICVIWPLAFADVSQKHLVLAHVTHRLQWYSIAAVSQHKWCPQGSPLHVSTHESELLHHGWRDCSCWDPVMWHQQIWVCMIGTCDCYA